MNQKKKISRKMISYVLALVMVLSTMTGIVPGMSLTAYAAGVNYIDSSGTSQTANATELAEGTTTWAEGSWYIVPAGGLTISSRITVNGTVNLILRDDATLTASAGITTTNATLNIYAQSAGTGALTAKGSNGCAGIGGCGGEYGCSGGAGGTVSIFGGTVTATGGTAAKTGYGGGAGIGGGGAGLSGENRCSGGAGGTVSIFGGTVTATGGAGNYSGAGAGIGGGGKDRRGSDGASGTLTLGAGVKLYSGTNNSGTVLDGNDSTERSYSSSRPQNMFAELYTGPNKTDLNTAIAEATTFSGTLNGTDYSSVKDYLNTAITAATTVKDKADATQEEVNAAVTALNKVLTEAKSSKGIISFIRGLDEAAPDMVITVDEQREGIKQNAAAFDALSDDAKANIPEEVQSTLAAYIAAVNGYEFREYKSTKKNEADGKAQEDDSDAATAFITAAKEAIDGLTYNAEKTLAENKAAVDAIITQLEADLADQRAADPVITMINELPSSEEVTTGDKNKIDAARDAYNYLTGTQKSKIKEEILKRLTDAEAALKEATDKEKAGTVSATLNALPNADEVTTADKKTIEAARKAYNALTDDQKSKVTAETLKKLTDAEDALAAAAVSDTINTLPNADEVTTADKGTIEAARKAYDDLTDAQEGYVKAETLKKLTDAEDALVAAKVSDEIAALKKADEVTTSDKEAIEAARKDYDALKDAQKYVSADTLKKLTDAEEALAAAEVSDEIAALTKTDEVTISDKEAIEKARKDYDALKDAQKYVSADTLKKLTDAEKALKELTDKAAADSVTDTINKLPASDKVATTDKAAIEEARKAYDALTADQKAKVTPETLKNLEAAEKALAAAEKKETDDTDAAKKVTDTINALPASDKVATTDKAAIESARKAYDALTAEQKAKVTPDTLKNLEAAEKALATAEKKEAADTDTAKKVTDAINKLPASDKVATTDKAVIEAARKAYDALTADQKKKVSADTLKKLTDAEAALKTAEAKDKAAKELETAKAEAQAAMNEQVTVTQKGKKFTVKWKKSSVADGYYVYAQYCGKKITKPAKTIAKNTTTKTTITKINGKKINQKKQFRVYVVPYKIIDGKKVALGKSTVAHLVGAKSTKYSNVKKLTLTKKKYTIKVGKTAKIKAKVTLVNKNKKHIPKGHGAKFRYKSSDTSIATVDKNGKIKGIKKGTCTIYVYSINGLMKKAKVTIK